MKFIVQSQFADLLLFCLKTALLNCDLITAYFGFHSSNIINDLPTGPDFFSIWGVFHTVDFCIGLEVWSGYKWKDMVGGWLSVKYSNSDRIWVKSIKFKDTHVDSNFEAILKVPFMYSGQNFVRDTNFII